MMRQFFIWHNSRAACSKWILHSEPIRFGYRWKGIKNPKTNLMRKVFCECKTTKYLFVPGISNGKLMIWLKRAIRFIIGQINGIPKGKSFSWSVWNVVECWTIFSHMKRKKPENYNGNIVQQHTLVRCATIKWMRFICFVCIKSLRRFPS